MTSTREWMSDEVIACLRREIVEAGSTETFAVLTKQGDGPLYDQVKVVCRGTTSEVPALVSRTKPGDMTLHNHPSGILRPSNADMNVATLFGEEGVGAMIVNNAVSECRVIVEPVREERPVLVETQDVERIFAADGPLAHKLDPYEIRESQLQMALAVSESLNESRILAVEAGTGTGKSLAYLVPTLLWTKHNKGRVTIATKTIALQEQLVYKDIPLARSVIQDAPRAVLVKGRNNYVCLRKLNDLTSNQLALFVEEEENLKSEIENLAAWVTESGSGDRADLPFVPSKDAWEAVRSDADMCLGSKCPFFQKAPFYESRRQAAQARVLIVNQALLFSDLALRGASGNYKASAVIPPYEHVILDEAHSMEDIATDHFAKKISSLGLRLGLGKFLSASRGNRGMIHRLYQAADEHRALGLLKSLKERLIPEFRMLQENVIQQLHAMSRALHEALNRDNKRQRVVWLKETLLASGVLDEAKHEGKALLGLLHELVLVIRQIGERLGNESESFTEKVSGVVIEMEARLNRLENTMAALKNFAISIGENQVPWLELKIGRQFEEFEYKISPLDVSPMLREALFKPFKSVILTSATLDLHDNYAFLSSRNGLKDWEERAWSFLNFKSPFDYASQAGLMLVKMATDPSQIHFVNDLAMLILEVAMAGHPGGTLVLFTSYKLLYAVGRHLEQPLGRAGMDLMIQGRASRSYLLHRMKQTHGVLLGTDSFWEGIDLPGAALTKLIITKLPFRQIGDPIFEARCTALDANGRSSFKEYSLPLALLKFKQGAGRLIRNKRDKGFLIVTDNRISGKSYGKKFLNLVDTYPLWKLDTREVTAMLKSVETNAR